MTLREVMPGLYPEEEERRTRARVFPDVRKGRQDGVKPSRRGPEYALQIRIACWLQAAFPPECGVWWGAWDAGFSSARAAFFRRLRGVKAGTPDFCFAYRGRVRWVELKFSRKTRPSRTQRQVFKELEAAGCRWAICYIGPEVERTLRRWRFPVAVPYRDDYPIPPKLTRHERRGLTDLGARRVVNRARREIGLEPLPPQARREVPALPPLAELRAAEAVGPDAVKALWARVRAEAADQAA